MKCATCGEPVTGERTEMHEQGPATALIVRMVPGYSYWEPCGHIATAAPDLPEGTESALRDALWVGVLNGERAEAARLRSAAEWVLSECREHWTPGSTRIDNGALDALRAALSGARVAFSAPDLPEGTP